jgi:alkylation response protein AidB-like acyl-CoA dehydrogenase
VLNSLVAGGAPGPEASTLKLAGTEIGWETAVVATGLFGPSAGLADAAWTQRLLGAPGGRIAGGTSQIQRNIIGERVLGLPKEPGLA